MVPERRCLDGRREALKGGGGVHSPSEAEFLMYEPPGGLWSGVGGGLSRNLLLASVDDG